ncbi:unnamed protein product [Adineta steineri]|uniref:Uncharacterized protein n=2 Tax=Adineta steineri TaxID=433720 RepID=A0A815U474_9BILA|nr:unnamed protein product [Adineta steineri]CAF1647271.1 unnamed protein product [Adineta steineri]
MIFITCTSARARNWDDSEYYDKRLFGCIALGEPCKHTLLAKACCEKSKCHPTTNTCVSVTSSGTWLDHRNGK